MTLHIDETFVNGMLFAIYAAGVIIIAVASFTLEEKLRLNPVVMLLVSFLWPVALPVIFICAHFTGKRKV